MRITAKDQIKLLSISELFSQVGAIIARAHAPFPPPPPVRAVLFVCMPLALQSEQVRERSALFSSAATCSWGSISSPATQPTPTIPKPTRTALYLQQLHGLSLHFSYMSGIRMHAMLQKAEITAVQIHNSNKKKACVKLSSRYIVLLRCKVC